MNEITHNPRIASEKVVQELASISKITEASSASVEEILGSIEEQDQKISDIEFSFKELEKMTQSLQMFVQ